MVKACDFEKGMVVEINKQPHVIKSIETKTPSARGAATLYKTKFTNLITGQNLDQSLKGDDSFQEIDCQKCGLQFLYADNENANFMDVESYMQYTLNLEDIKEEMLFLQDGMEDIIGLVSEEKLIAIQIPTSVEMEVVETPPAMKAASASARTKPATLETGVIVQVPEYISQGERIIVNTETKKFISKA